MSWRWSVPIIMELRDASLEWLEGKTDGSRLLMAVAQFVYMRAHDAADQPIIAGGTMARKTRELVR